MNHPAAEQTTGRLRPQPGDVVITCHGRPRTSFGVGTMPEPPQLTFTSLEQALARARRFAGHARVDAWMMEGPGDVRLVASHRAGGHAPGVSEAAERQ
jgi:hypothetical protein